MSPPGSPGLEKKGAKGKKGDGEKIKLQNRALLVSDGLKGERSNMANAVGGPSPVHPLHVSLFPSHIDGLIVLGARLNPQGEPGRVARLRLVHALNLWRGCNCRVYVLISGGCSQGSACSEARAMADWARRWVREHWGEEVSQSLKNCLILEEASLTTAASARHALPMVAARGSSLSPPDFQSR